MKTRPDIPVIYEGTFPKDFVNDVNGWGSFSKKILQDNFGKLLSLDIDYGRRRNCSLNCPHCFRVKNKADGDGGHHEVLDHAHMISIVKEAKELGLISVKFLGAGEPFEAEGISVNENGKSEEFHFLEFLRILKSLNVIPSIFTKGYVIGKDDLVKKYYSRYGISTGKELVAELKRVNASILLGFNSFDKEIQNKMVGGKKDYTDARNRALELLVEEGFNEPKPHKPTRICLAVNPITNENYDEAVEIYKWARVRNLYAIVCPTMISGICATPKIWRDITPSADKIVNMYAEIYKFNIEKRIQTLEQIKEEGVSAYAGGHPCNQVGCGMYITVTGTVLRCPGDDVTVLGNVWEDSLKDIWLKSENYGRSGTLNCYCPPKWGKSIPTNLFTDVILELEKWQRRE